MSNTGAGRECPRGSRRPGCSSSPVRGRRIRRLSAGVWRAHPPCARPGRRYLRRARRNRRFDSEKTLKETYPKLIKSYALDAISPLPPHEASTPGGDRKSAEEFLNAAAKADGKAYPSQGEGKDLRVSGWQTTGSATSIAPPGVRRR